MLKYNLHDSLIESVNYDFKNMMLDITIDLCNWLQDNYVESEPENIIIHMIFSNVISFDTKFLNFKFDSNEIIDVIEIDNNTIKIVFMGEKDIETFIISANKIMFCLD